jgi:copper homeostasis protein
MLREEGGFQVGKAALDALCASAPELRDAGADGFVFGFLTDAGELDLTALHRLADACGSPWTLHRAFDHVARPSEAYGEAARLPSIDRILTSGGRPGLEAGTAELASRATWQTPGRPVFVAGGGLRPEHVRPLRHAGLAEFHTGSGVRPDRSYAAPVDRALVTRFAELVHGS